MTLSEIGALAAVAFLRSRLRLHLQIAPVSEHILPLEHLSVHLLWFPMMLADGTSVFLYILWFPWQFTSFTNWLNFCNSFEYLSVTGSATNLSLTFGVEETFLYVN